MGQATPNDVALAYSMAFDQATFHRRDEYRCDKCGVVRAPNSLVYMLCYRLDGDLRVKSFRHGNVRYEYYHPERRSVAGSFFDFDVRMLDGSRRLLYVTPCLYVHTPVEEAMIEGAECRARDLGAAFELWTEAEIFGPNPAYAKSVTRYIMDKLFLTVKEDEDLAR